MKVFFKYRNKDIESASIVSLIILLASKTDYVYDAQIGIVNGIIEISIFVDYNIG